MIGQMRQWLESSGYKVTGTLRGEEGVAMVRKRHFDLVLLDYNLRLERGGAQNADHFIPSLRRYSPATPIIIVTATADNLQADQLGVEQVLLVRNNLWREMLTTVAIILANNEEEGYEKQITGNR